MCAWLYTSYRSSSSCCMQMMSTSQPPSIAASARRRTRGSKGYQSKVIIPTRMDVIILPSFPAELLYEVLRLVRIHLPLFFLLLLSTRYTQSFQATKRGACNSARYTVRGGRNR